MTQINAIGNVEIRNGYYKSGALCLETPYVNGERHGIEKEYYESGALWVETPYVDDSIHGIVKVYYESGALLNEAPYVDGEIHGIMKTYDEDKANIVCLALYDKGREVTYKKNLIYKEINHDSE
jgi:antitoxin component YwqK of YwqJK toxin-antitoxin module